MDIIAKIYGKQIEPLKPVIDVKQLPVIYDGKDEYRAEQEAEKKKLIKEDDGFFSFATDAGNSEHRHTLSPYGDGGNLPFHKKLEYAEQNFKPPFSGINHEVADSTIHSLLKTGIDQPKYNLINKIVNDSSHSAKEKEYLTLKYDFARHLIKKPQTIHTDSNDLFLEPHEVKHAISMGYRPNIGRIFHNSLHIPHELHQNGDLVPIEHIEDHSTAVKLDNSHLNHLHGLLKEHNTGLDDHEDIKHIRKYTDFSTIVNQTIGRQHEGKALDFIHNDRLHESLEISDGISKTIAKHIPYANKLTVYSGMSSRNDPEKVNKSIPEHTTTILHSPTFLSTSINPTVAGTFSRSKKLYTHNDAGLPIEDTSEYGVPINDVLKITIPSNHKHGLYVDPISSNQGEHEYIFDKGSSFKVSKTHKLYADHGKLIRLWDAEPHQE